MNTLKATVAVLCVCSLLLVACENKAWTDYYDNNQVEVPTSSMMDYLQSQPDLTTFCELLKIAGYDEFLSGSLSFTVWAPNNEALKDIDKTDVQSVTELVKSHLAYFSISTSAARKEKISLLSGKVVDFVGNQFGPCQLTKPNVNVTNGLVHHIAGYYEYKPNLWEMMQRCQGELDSISTYLLSLSKKEFRPDLSTELGYNADAQPIYDSVFVDANYFLNRVADLSDEDTLLTVLFPNNEAWDAFYGRVSNYYRVSPKQGGTAKQREYTARTMTNNLVFPGLIDLNNLPDSLITTTGTVLRNVDDLFKDVHRYETSNGYLYVSDSIRIQAEDAWLKTIKVEAENGSYGRSLTNAFIQTRSAIGKNIKVSGNHYLLMQPSSDASTLSKVYVNFPIPNVLSTKYDIKCVFVPESIEEAKPRQSKINIELDYVDEEGNQVLNKAFKENFLTSKEQLDTVMVGQMDFSFSNLYQPREMKTSDITTRLCIRNRQFRETTKLTNTVRIDCIIFEPSKD